MVIETRQSQSVPQNPVRGALISWMADQDCSAWDSPGAFRATTRSPVASANFCNSTFHSRLRLPFEPPPSAVISNRCACGYAVRPIRSHHRRSVSTANTVICLLRAKLATRQSHPTRPFRVSYSQGGSPCNPWPPRNCQKAIDMLNRKQYVVLAHVQLSS